MTGMFIAASIFLSLTIGPFMSIIILGSVNFRNKFLQVTITILLALAIGIGLTGAMVIDDKRETEAYNNGVCSWCGVGHYHLSAVNGINCKTYYYECDSCGHIIQTGHAFNR